MIPSAQVLDFARGLRETGFVAQLGAGDIGMADPGAIEMMGRDALEFAHSQVTNDVLGLAPGSGNASARVTRQGQLLELFSVHRLDVLGGTDRLWLVLPRERVAGLLELLNETIFADDVTLSDQSGEWQWWTLHGSQSAGVLDDLWPLSQGSWTEVGENSATWCEGPDASSARPLVIRRSLTGDLGFLVAFPKGAGEIPGRAQELQAAAVGSGLVALEEPELSASLEVQRIEAGIVRVGPDTSGRKRILPETGLEQYAVSYTKGCYLGQEVIARVRTYGSLPYSLRGVVLKSDELDARSILGALPGEGETLCLEDGVTLGQMASRTLSPTLDAAVAYVYLDKSHRTPGAQLELDLEGRRVTASVQLLPFYRAPDQASRVAWLYDRAVRDFAAGREDVAVLGLEEALQIDPSFSDGYEAMGVIFGRSERFHEAIDSFKRLEEIAPHEPMVNTNLSLYFMKIGDKETAEIEAAKAMQKDMAQRSGHSVSEEALHQVLDEQRRADAMRKKEMFGQVLEIDAEDGVALFGLGNALSVLEEWGPAAEAYAQAVRVEPDNSAVYLARAKALEKLARPQEALAVYRAGMDVASRKGDLMPLGEMEHRALLLSGGKSELKES